MHTAPVVCRDLERKQEEVPLMMRGLDTTVRKIRRRVFKEVAMLGFTVNEETLNDDVEAIPYKIVSDESNRYRESVYRSRCNHPGAF